MKIIISKILSKYLLTIILGLTSIQLFSQNKYIPEYSDPFTEAWRWNQFTALDGEGIVDFTEDLEGNMWFLGTNKLIKYDGYSWKNYKLPSMQISFSNNYPALNSIHDGIALHSSNGLFILRDTIWTLETPIINKIGLRLDCNKTLSIDKDFYVTVTAYGVVVSKNNQKYLYSSTRYLQYFDSIQSIKKIVLWDDDIKYVNFLDVYKVNDQLHFYCLLHGNITAVINPDSSKEPITFTNLKSTFNTTYRGRVKLKIVNDYDSTIWICSDLNNHGVQKVKNGVMTEYDMNKLFGDRNTHSDIALMNDGTIVVAGQGQIYSYRNEQWKRYRMPDIPATSTGFIKLHTTRDGNLWIGGLKTEIFLFEYSNEIFLKLNKLFYQTTDNENKKWFIEKSSKIVVNNGNEWIYYDEEQNAIELPKRVYAAENGWIISSGRHKNRATVAILYKGIWKHIYLPAILKDTDKRALYVDNDESLWIGSSSSISDALIRISKEGIDDFLRSGNEPMNITEKDILPNSISNNKIPGVIECENFDYGGEGVAYHDNTPVNRDEVYRTTESVDLKRVNAFSNEFYVSNATEGEWLRYTITRGEPGNYTLILRVSNGNQTKCKAKVSINEEVVETLTITNTNWLDWKLLSLKNIKIDKFPCQLKIETISGGANFDYVEFRNTNSIEKNSIPTAYDELADKRLSFFRNESVGIINGPNNMLYTSLGRSVNKISKNDSILDIIMSGDVSQLTGFRNKLLWIGTDDNGIYRHDGLNTEHFTMNDGLVSNVVVNIFADSDSTVWVATEKDISRFDGETWITNCFSKEFNLEKEGGEIRVDMDGAVWISVLPKTWNLKQSVSELSSIHKEDNSFYCVRIVPDKNPPISQIDFFNEIVEQDGNTHIKWSGHDLWNKTNSEELLFSYKLNDTPWTKYDKTIDHTFLSLASGDYTLRLKAKDKYGNTSNIESVNFTVLPPVWKRIWFILLVLSFISIVVFLITRIIKRNNKLEHANAVIMERQMEVMAQSEEIEAQNESIREQNIELEEANATKNKFFSIIAHDIKNPFNAILGFSEILTRKFDTLLDQQKIEIAKVILESSHNLYQLLENLLHWSRSQRGVIEFNPENIELKNLFRGVLDIMKSTADAKDISMSIKLQDEGVFVKADQQMLETIVRNLIGNAIKYTNSGGSIQVSAEMNDGLVDIKVRDNSFVKVAVTDNGIGMTKDIIKTLLRIDTHQSTPGTNNEKGTGLGLILVKEFVSRHGGIVGVESEVGKGSTFYFTMPLGE